MRKPKRSAEQLTALIKKRATQEWPWPPKMTMMLYPSDNGWEVMISPGKTVREEEFRISAMWVAVQLQAEFDLRW